MNKAKEAIAIYLPVVVTCFDAWIVFKLTFGIIHLRRFHRRSTTSAQILGRCAGYFSLARTSAACVRNVKRFCLRSDCDRFSQHRPMSILKCDAVVRVGLGPFRIEGEVTVPLAGCPLDVGRR
jgi:hypothetical protein